MTKLRALKPINRSRFDDKKEEEDEEDVETPPHLTIGQRRNAMKPVVRRRGNRYVSWKTSAVRDNGVCCCPHFSSLVQGFSSKSLLSDEEVEEDFRKLARLLLLLREYMSRFGMPEMGGPREQKWVLKEICKQLYSSGTPIWVLQEVMERAAQGLTGDLDLNFFLLPRNAFIFNSSSSTTTTTTSTASNNSTDMFRYERGFHIHKLTIMERILVRVASFATNTETLNSIKCNFPNPQQKFKNGPPRGESIVIPKQRKELAKEILDLASTGTGLFFFTQAKEYPSEHGNVRGLFEMDSFWEVEAPIQELFTRLATVEAGNLIDVGLKEVEEYDSKYYKYWMAVLFRMLNSFCVTGFWFDGSWYDMIAAGSLSFFVTIFQGKSIWNHNRFIFEVMISFGVGLGAALLALNWPDHLCFRAIALGSVVDILQGFKIVYSIMELMSKNTVAGGADFIESFLFTGLITIFLKIGQFVALEIYKVWNKEDTNPTLGECCDPIDDKRWYFLLVPIASIAWTYLFQPGHGRGDIILMIFHGLVAYSVYEGLQLWSGEKLLGFFFGAFFVTFISGIVSRFTGRQALGNTVTGLYALVPGAYLVDEFFEVTSNDDSNETTFISSSLFNNIILNSVVIGLGAWTGTIVVSPTILGTNHHLMKYNKWLRKSKEYWRGRPSSADSSAERPAMLYF